jgi:hypothetical protein
MSIKVEPIHRWDGSTIIKAFLAGAAIEALLIAPAALSPWGHAGPESFWGWVSLFLNVPGGVALGVLRRLTNSHDTVSVAAAFTYVYIIQTVMIAYITFLCLRLKKRRGNSKTLE